ncbi:MAG: hypothetical protein EA401_10955 [Planctomycetota bacterium]|nr:MAG: hypothetical protein EA401_10955 [Planctomycetota bacterium]
MNQHYQIVTPPAPDHFVAAAICSVALRSGRYGHPSRMICRHLDDLDQALEAARHLKETVVILGQASQVDSDRAVLLNGDDIVQVAVDWLKTQKALTDEALSLFSRRRKLQLKAKVILNQAAGSDRLDIIDDRLPLLTLPVDLENLSDASSERCDTEYLRTFGVSAEDSLLFQNTDRLVLLHTILGSSPQATGCREALLPVLNGSRSKAWITGEVGTGKTDLAAMLSERLSTKRRKDKVMRLEGRSPDRTSKESVFAMREGTLVIDDLDLLPDAILAELQATLEHEKVRWVITSHPRADRRLRSFLPILGRYTPIAIPSIDERRQDLHVVAQAMLGVLGRALGIPSSELELAERPGALSALFKADYPANVVSLKIALEQALRTGDWTFAWMMHSGGQSAVNVIRLPVTREDLTTLPTLNAVVQSFVESVHRVTGSQIETAKVCGWSGPGGRNAVKRWLEGRGKIAE